LLGSAPPIAAAAGAGAEKQTAIEKAVSRDRVTLGRHERSIVPHRVLLG
jgi:hypothetical protein